MRKWGVGLVVLGLVLAVVGSFAILFKYQFTSSIENVPGTNMTEEDKNTINTLFSTPIGIATLIGGFLTIIGLVMLVGGFILPILKRL